MSIERPKREENVMKEFKVGDKVYSTVGGTNIHTIGMSCVENYPLMVGLVSLTKCGRHLASDTRPSIFHATPENKSLLDALYGVEFEAPPVKLSGSELTLSKLEEFGKPILCWVGDYSDERAITDKHVTLISKYHEGEFVTPSDVHWQYAVPYTGEEFLTGRDFE